MRVERAKIRDLFKFELLCRDIRVGVSVPDAEVADDAFRAYMIGDERFKDRGRRGRPLFSYVDGLIMADLGNMPEETPRHFPVRYHTDYLSEMFDAIAAAWRYDCHEMADDLIDAVADLVCARTDLMKAICSG